jgi:glycogenin glucosyltransferase
MLTDDENYMLSALKLGHSLRTHTQDPFDMVAMELATKPLNTTAWSCLRAVGWQRCVVDRISPLDENATRRYSARFEDQFTKLHLWDMTMYETLVYLDSDTLTLRSISHLLHHNLDTKRIAVSAETRYCKVFNMGVVVIHPDAHEYQRLRQLQQDPAIKFDAKWAEQGFLNVVYKDQWADLGLINNALARVSWQDHAYWTRNYAHINIIHYVGMKPWVCFPDAFIEWLIFPSAYYTPLCQLWKDSHPQTYANLI